MTIPQANGFPSDFVPLETKKSQKYALMWAKAVWEENTTQSWNGDTQRNRIINNRREAAGKSDVNKFKTLYSNLANSVSDNLNWDIQTPLYGFVKNIYGSLVNQDLRIDAQAGNPSSGTKYDKEKDKLISTLILSKQADKIEQETGIDIKSKIPRKNIFDSEEDIELFMSTWKEDTCIILEDIIAWVFRNCNSEYLRGKIVYDLITCAIAATKTDRDINGDVKVRYVDIANLITSYSKDDDFTKIKYAGEMQEMDLVKLGEISDFDDDTLFQIAQGVAGQDGNANWNSSLWGNSYYPTGSNGRSNTDWKKFKVRVLDLEYHSLDKITKQKVSIGKGNATRLKKQAKRKGEKVVGEVGSKVGRWYKVSWIIGTDYCFNYGLKTNQVFEKINGKYASSSECSYTIYAPFIYDEQNTSLLEVLKAHSDEAKVALIKLQDFIATLPPDVIVYDMDGLLNALAGLDDASLTPYDLIEDSRKRGILISSSKTSNKNFNNTKPMYEIPTGIGNKQQTYVETYLFHVRQMEAVTGIPLSTVMSPDKDALVGIEKLKAINRNNSLREIDQSLKRIWERTAKKVALNAIDIVTSDKEKAKEYGKAIGFTEARILEQSKDFALEEYDISLKTVVDIEKKERYREKIQFALQQGFIKPSDAEEAEQLLEVNPDKIPMRLRIAETKYRNEKMQEAQNAAAANAEQQIKSTQVANQLEAQNEQLKHQLELQRMQMQFQYDFKLKQLDIQGDLTEQQLEGQQKIDQIETASEIAMKQENNDTGNSLSRTSFSKSSGVRQPSTGMPQ